jgi:hypothetical protein
LFYFVVITRFTLSLALKQPPMNRPPPPFSGMTLEQVLQFVLPEDVARVSMVCKTWRDEIKPPPKLKSDKETNHATGGVATNSNNIWKHSIINSSPKVMQAIIASSRGGDGDEAAASAKNIDFHALAMSDLSRKRKKPAELPGPTFRFEDLLIVLELKLQHG